MKIAVSSYSFMQAMQDGRLDILSVIPAAKKLGYAGIEIVRGNWTHEEAKALARQLKQQSLDYDLPIIAYMTDADFLKNGLKPQIETLKKEVEIASLLGTARMRHDSTAGVDAQGRKLSVCEALPIVAEGYRQVTEFAKDFKIQTMIENHGTFFQDANKVKALIEKVDHPNFGWLVDMGNFLCVDQTPLQAVKIGAPLAVHAHAKDFHLKKKGDFIPSQGWFLTQGGNALRGAIIGHGIVDVPSCLSLLKQAGYDGWLSVEFEGIEDCLMALEADLANLKQMLEM